MAANARADGLAYEFETTPETGSTMPVAEGVHWLRMPLPFALSHINLWLLQDGDEWVIVDTGLHTDESTDIWDRQLRETMGGRRVNRIVATHLHPDHAGNAGWLSQRCAARLLMTRNEYLMCRVLIADTGHPAPEAGLGFYHAAGFADDATERYQKMFGMFGRVMSAMPESYIRLQDGDVLDIGNQQWEVIVGNGHSPEHACLFCPGLNLLLSGDQILPTISSNVSVYPTEPEANPLLDWLTSIDKLSNRLPDDVLVLPAHGRPFRGVHARLQALKNEHLDDLRKAAAMCAEPQRAVDIFPALFRREISSREMILATGESVAHLNWLINDGRVTRETDEAGVHWYRNTA